MTVFRNNAEPSPMPEANSQLQQTAELTEPQPAPGTKVASWTGADAGLSQSLADLRKGYLDAAKVQSDASRDATLARAAADAQIAGNIPRPSVEVTNAPELADRWGYSVGDASAISSTDPIWKMPLDHLRTNLQLVQQMHAAVKQMNR